MCTYIYIYTYTYRYVRYLYIYMYIHTLYTFVLFLDRPPVQAGPDSRPAQGCAAQCALGKKMLGRPSVQVMKRGLNT